jgi:hypothetical protein
LALAPVVLVIFTFFNFYKKRKFQKPEINYIKNMRFIQMMMGQASDGVTLAYEFIDDFIYWKQPDKSIILIKEALKLPIVIFIGMYYVNIRSLMVLGIWGIALLNSPFAMTLATIIVHKVSLIRIYESLVHRKCSTLKLNCYTRIHSQKEAKYYKL